MKVSELIALLESSERAQLKKLAPASTTVGFRKMPGSRSGASWGLYWDGELVATILSSGARFREKQTWELLSLDSRPLSKFDGAEKAKAWALENAEAIARLGPTAGPNAHVKLLSLIDAMKAGAV